MPEVTRPPSLLLQQIILQMTAGYFKQYFKISLAIAIYVNSQSLLDNISCREPNSNSIIDILVSALSRHQQAP